MSKTHRSTVHLTEGFAKNAPGRASHINQQLVIDGAAIRDLQRYGLSKGQAVDLISPKRGSRCVGLLRHELAL